MADTDFLVSACLLALASNIEAERHLAACRQALGQCGELVVSPVLINECQKKVDGISVPAYHNQVALLRFNSAISYPSLMSVTKQLEQANGRANSAKPLVTLDVDILAVKPSAKALAVDAMWTAIGDDWLALTRRLPLASYDQYGVAHLPPPYASWFADLSSVPA